MTVDRASISRTTAIRTTAHGLRSDFWKRSDSVVRITTAMYPTTSTALVLFRATESLRRVTLTDCFDTSISAFAVITNGAIMQKQGIQIRNMQRTCQKSYNTRTSTRRLAEKISTSVSTLVDILKEFSRLPAFPSDDSLPTEQLNTISLGFIEAKENLFDAIHSAAHRQGHLLPVFRESDDYKADRDSTRRLLLPRSGQSWQSCWKSFWHGNLPGNSSASPSLS